MTTIPDGIRAVDLLCEKAFLHGEDGFILRGLTNKGNQCLAEISYVILNRYYYLPEDCGGEPVFIADDEVSLTYSILVKHAISGGCFSPEDGLSVVPMS